MPPSGPPLPAYVPAPLTSDEERLALSIIRKHYGDDAVARNWSPDPKQLHLHVESGNSDSRRFDACMGELLCRFVRDRIWLNVSTPGQKATRDQKLAYRSGVILAG